MVAAHTLSFSFRFVSFSFSFVVWCCCHRGPRDTFCSVHTRLLCLWPLRSPSLLLLLLPSFPSFSAFDRNTCRWFPRVRPRISSDSVSQLLCQVWVSEAEFASYLLLLLPHISGSVWVLLPCFFTIPGGLEFSFWFSFFRLWFRLLFIFSACDFEIPSSSFSS